MDPKLLQQIEDYLKASGLIGKELADRMDAIRNSTVEFNRELANSTNWLNSINDDVDDLSQTFKNVLDDIRKWDSTTNKIGQSYRKLTSIADKLKYDTKEIDVLSKNELKSLVEKANIEKNNLLARKKELDLKYAGEDLNELARTAREFDLQAELKQIENYRELLGIFDDNDQLKEDENNYIKVLLTLLEQRLTKEKNINKNLGITGQLYKSIQKTLSDLGVDSEILAKMNKKLRDMADNKIGFKELFKVTKEGFKEALEDPMFKFALGLKLFKSGINDIKKAFDIFKEYNGIFVENARAVGLATEQMEDMVSQASLAQHPLQQNIFSAKQIAEAISGINQQLGLSVEVSEDTANEFASMTNSMGLSVDEASKIYKLSTLNNKSLQDTNKLITSQIIAVQKSTGVQINARQVFQEIGKLNAGITAKFQQNPALIAKAVAQAKALGTTLEEIDKIGESLLNWESSIENELKAELITGRQLNFERARAAALTGDQVALMQEITNQVGTLSDFQSMNIIAQKSLADAFGMTREEMADMLQKQEVFNKLGDVSGKSAEEQLKIARKRGLTEEDSLVLTLKQQSAAEKLTAAFDSFKIILADLLSGPFGAMVDVMSYISKHAWLAYTAIGLIASISLVKLIGGIAMMAVSLAQAGVFASTLNAALTFGTGALLIAGAVAGTLAFMKAASNDATEMATPKLAEGGIVPATPGGRLVTVGEGGKDEAIIPLDSTKSPLMFGKTNSIDFTPLIETIEKTSSNVTNAIDFLNKSVTDSLTSTLSSITPLAPPIVNETNNPEITTPTIVPATSVVSKNELDFTPIADAIKELRTAIDNLNRRPAMAYINGKNAFASELGRESSLGTSQVINSTNLA